MLDLREALNALYGTYRLARLDPRGMTFFNATLDGFWRSFFAAAIVAPLFVLLIALRYANAETTVEPLRMTLAEGIGYVISWVAYPLAMVPVARALGREHRYFAYLCAYNWSSVLQNLVFVPVVLLGISGLIPATATAYLSLMVTILVLGYVWFIAKTALDVSGIAAAGLVALDFVLSTVVNTAVDVIIARGA
jgi:hypothetical protein